MTVWKLKTVTLSILYQQYDIGLQYTTSVIKEQKRDKRRELRKSKNYDQYAEEKGSRQNGFQSQNNKENRMNDKR